MPLHRVLAGRAPRIDGGASREAGAARRERAEAACISALGRSQAALNLYTVDEIGCVEGAPDPRAAWLACYPQLAAGLRGARAAWLAAGSACRGVRIPRPGVLSPVSALSLAPRRGRDLALLGAEMAAARRLRRLPPARRWQTFTDRVVPLMQKEARQRPGAIPVR